MLVVKMEAGTLLAIKQILVNFEILSGLGCNVEKITLMQVGSTDEISDEIKALGFEQKNEIKILRMKNKKLGKML
jgi:hypothetical protein